jgi:hypothetical protein
MEPGTQKNPALHGPTQALLFAPRTLENWPAGHNEHPAEEPVEYCPAAQRVHEVAPVVLLNCPAMHPLQPVARATEEKDPGVQLVQTPPRLYLPAPHAIWVCGCGRWEGGHGGAEEKTQGGGGLRHSTLQPPCEL